MQGLRSGVVRCLSARNQKPGSDVLSVPGYRSNPHETSKARVQGSRSGVVRCLQLSAAARNQEPGSDVLSVPAYRSNPHETSQVKRARLLYQSRKRGMLENDLLLSTFVDKYLFSMDDKMLSEYDQLINSQYSDWDIYYWLVGAQSTPPMFQNSVMALLKEHVRNSAKEKRIRQPDLPVHMYK